ncbi:PepSY-associated TM helix domain-containing protein [Tumebacillus permanentifrigoris]|uniref:Putative iron-regulated membrane protein n=1 Tax=Tumebacillus permanentifrigoris TaxID=378543 RepID=A0A316D4D6_9BACL|nr:PepSY-associated TM helix domain-containing protein [Tumebacillus permanentifrigoris]PWK07426.1 putative iron-regulated membrane protein [Tumebacillus permanentifrigoris]
MKKWMLKLHLGLSLVVGVFFVAICLSGSVLVLREDLKQWAHPELYETTAGRVPLELIKTNALQELPGSRITLLETPEAADGRFHVRMTQEADGKTQNRDLYLDPGTGHVLGKTEGGNGAFLDFMIKLHEYLLLGDVFGRQTARYVESAMGVGLALVLITGAIVWWPGLRKFALGFKIIRKKGQLMLQRGLHKSLGIISVPFLLVLALTGASFTLDKDVFGWFGASAREEAPKAALKATPSGKELTLDQLVANVQQAHPNTQLMRISLPKAKDQSVRLFLEEGYSPTRTGNTNVYVDPYAGNLLWKSNPASGLNTYTTWRAGLHFGTWGGTFSKLLYVLIGVLPLFFMVTGLTIWALKAKVRRQSRRKQVATGRSVTT